MRPAVSNLLRRLITLAAGTTIISDVQAVQTPRIQFLEGTIDNSGSLSREITKISKLVFGRMKSGSHQFAGHASHSSHVSHYSGTSGGGLYIPDSPPQSTPTTPPPPQYVPQPVIPARPPTPAPAIAAASTKPAIPDTNQILAAVLKKLPKVRSKWPKEGKLIKDSHFMLHEGDTIVGIVELNTGAKIKVQEITLENALVIVGGIPSAVPVTNTNIIELMGGSAVILALPDDPVKKTDTTPTQK
jgi:hypothetical protein